MGHMDWVQLPVMVAKLAVALVLAFAIGWERERHDRPAGLRTHILVCLGSTLLTIVSESYGPQSDPARISAQIVSGIGFLGAGTILRHGSVVRGLTTAASLWTVAAIGIAVGRGGTFFVLAGAAALLVYVTLTFLNQLEGLVGEKRSRYELTLVYDGEVDRSREIAELLSASQLSIERFNRQSAESPGLHRVTYSVRLPSAVPRDQISRRLADVAWIRNLEWS